MLQLPLGTDQDGRTKMEGLLEVTALDDQSMAKRSLDKGSTPQVPKEAMTKDLLDGPSLRELPKSPWTTRSNLHHRDGERGGSSVNGNADVIVPDPPFIQG